MRFVVYGQVQSVVNTGLGRRELVQPHLQLTRDTWAKKSGQDSARAECVRPASISSVGGNDAHSNKRKSLEEARLLMSASLGELTANHPALHEPQAGVRAVHVIHGRELGCERPEDREVRRGRRAAPAQPGDGDVRPRLDVRAGRQEHRDRVRAGAHPRGGVHVDGREFGRGEALDGDPAHLDGADLQGPVQTDPDGLRHAGPPRVLQLKREGCDAVRRQGGEVREEEAQGALRLIPRGLLAPEQTPVRPPKRQAAVAWGEAADQAGYEERRRGLGAVAGEVRVGLVAGQVRVRRHGHGVRAEGEEVCGVGGDGADHEGGLVVELQEVPRLASQPHRDLILAPDPLRHLALRTQASQSGDSDPCACHSNTGGVHKTPTETARANTRNAGRAGARGGGARAVRLESLVQKDGWQSVPPTQTAAVESQALNWLPSTVAMRPARTPA